MSPSRPQTAFLFDVDNALLDNDRVIADLQVHLEGNVGSECAEDYWRIFEELRNEPGYADYLGALQCYRGEHQHDPAVFTVSRFLLEYPYSERHFPSALEAIEHPKQGGPAAILSDGDVVFLPRKVDCSGLFAAVAGRVFIYYHKEMVLADVAQRCAAELYAPVQGRLHIFSKVKNRWGSRAATVFVRHGHYAHDSKDMAQFPAADLSLDRIGDFLRYEPSQPL